MGRGRYPARLNVAPPPPEVAERYLQIWRNRELYATPEAFPAISSASLFGDNRPLEIDIGCATGELLYDMAAARPAVNFVGIEVALKPLYRAVEMASKRELTNLKFIQADALLALRRIPDEALQTSYLHFPAPMLRYRQRKQRLVSPEILAQLQRALAPSGVLSLLTDQEALFVEFLRLLPGLPALRMRGPAEHTLGDLIKSHYQRRWEARGRVIFRAELEKVRSEK